MRLLEEVQGGRVRPKFTDIFVDEAQDFLPADIECCYALRDGDNPVFIVVDQTQALHIGSSYQSPSSPPRSNWLTHELHGSYRLPVTIANCVRSLGESIQRSKEQEGLSTRDISLPNSRKASVVGVRPIVVAGDEVTLARSIQEIRSTYEGFLSAEDPLAESRGSRITICEKDSSLKGALGSRGLWVETTTIKKIKGLERGFLVWSTSSDLGNPDEWKESVYTICTRSSCILVIAVDPSKIPDQTVELLGALDREYLMFWDRDSRDWWDQTVSHD
jgi:superfamily I DNA and RNA helicase